MQPWPGLPNPSPIMQLRHVCSKECCCCCDMFCHAVCEVSTDFLPSMACTSSCCAVPVVLGFTSTSKLLFVACPCLLLYHRRNPKPFLFAYNLMVPGPPTVCCVFVFGSDSHPDALGPPPDDPEETDWEPFDFLMSRSAAARPDHAQDWARLAALCQIMCNPLPRIVK